RFPSTSHKLPRRAGSAAAVDTTEESATPVSNRVTLVTAGCQRLGHEICLQMAADRWRIAVSDINQEAGPRVVKKLREIGSDAVFVPGDLGTAQGPREVVRAAVEHCGRLDVLVN